MSDRHLKTHQPVCIVDDDIHVRRSLSRLLRSDGWSVRSFGNGQEFLRYARENPVALALVDVGMPDLGGLEVQAHLRKLFPELSTIIMTAADDPHIRTAAIQGGAAAFLSKPFEAEDLLKSIGDALGISGFA